MSDNPIDDGSVASNHTHPYTFYNNPVKATLDERDESQILYLRNFNNWIKSTLINHYLELLKREQNERKNEIHVFDMGCGKGGDQRKWEVGRVKLVTFADLAENSVDICKQRYHKGCFHYQAEFFPLDCTKEYIGDKISAEKPCFDLVSTQFVIHYSFETYQSANQFLRNAAECLRVGGYFIGTTVNSCQLVEKCRNSPDQSISNDIFSIRFDPSIDLRQHNNQSIPLFGAKYHFKLDKLVDCPEYLVYFPLLEQLAAKHGLKLVERKTFEEYFNEFANTNEGRLLLTKMKALQSYRLEEENSHRQHEPVIDHSQYTHAQSFIRENSKEHPHIKSCQTLSKEDWGVASLYIIFAFQKERHVEYQKH